MNLENNPDIRALSKMSRMVIARKFFLASALVALIYLAIATIITIRLGQRENLLGWFMVVLIWAEALQFLVKETSLGADESFDKFFGKLLMRL